MLKECVIGTTLWGRTKKITSETVRLPGCLIPLFNGVWGIGKHHIELLEILQKKTEGNLTDDEKRALDAVIYELRMQYVQAVTPPPPAPGKGKEKK